MRKRIGGRSRQVLNVIYRLGEVSAADILRELPDLPSYSAVRSILRALEEKGLVRHREKGLRYVYTATVSKRTASRSALRDLLDTFFDGSPLPAMQTLIEVSRDAGRDVDYRELKRLIDDARKEGR